jgi:hypothetical protein
MRVCFYDLETSPIISAVWALYDQNIPYQHVIQDTFVICASWKFQGESKIDSVSMLDDPKRFIKDHTDDYIIIKKLHWVFEQADVIVAHNGNKFDWKRFMARVVYHGLPPIDQPQMVDTLVEARKWKFTSNKLDDLAAHLKLPRKIENEKGLWVKAAQGDVKSIRAMIRYNKGDIPPLEKLYNKLLPYMKSTPNRNLYSDHECCPKCGSLKFQHRGYNYSRVSKFKKYQCKECFGWFTNKTRVKGAEFK